MTETYGLKQFGEFLETIKDVDIKYLDDLKRIESVKLIYDYKSIILFTDAECCSESWLEQKNNFEDLVGKNIKCIEEIKDPEYEDDHVREGNSIKKHFYEIKFRNSDLIFTFELLNSSNGYYDGYLIITETDNSRPDF